MNEWRLQQWHLQCYYGKHCSALQCRCGKDKPFGGVKAIMAGDFGQLPTVAVKSISCYTASCAFCRPHLPKVLLARQFFNVFLWDRALPTVSRTFCRPHLPKVLLARQVFYDFYVSSSSLSTVSCTFCRPHHLPKVLLARQFFTFFSWDRAPATVSCTSCRPHLPKVLRARQFFLRFFCETELSLYSLVHFLPTSSSKSAPSPAIFYDFLWDQIELSLQSRAISCTSCRPHLPKVLLARQFFTISLWDRALATVSCTFCRPHLPKVLLDQQSFYNFCVRSSSPYSLVHFLPTSSSKGAVSPTGFLRFLCEIELSLQSRALFDDLIFQKCS